MATTSGEAVSGVVGYGTYIPYFRLDRKSIAATLGSGGGRGLRAVASFDEDTTSMGAEALRNALAAEPRISPSALSFVTTEPAYLDKTNATAVHRAAGLSPSAFAADLGGSARSAVGAILAASDASRVTAVVVADTRTGRPGSADESAGGDAAVALLFGTDAPVCVLVAHASATAEFLDRWRLPGDPASRVWEERFGESEYLPLAEAAITDALKQAGITADQIDHLVVAGAHARAQGVIGKSAGVRAGVLADDLTSQVGAPGVAQLPLELVSVLDGAGANETIVTVNVADGVDVLVWRTTHTLPAFRDARSASAPTLATQIAQGNTNLGYPQFLTWKGFLEREPPRRPDPDRPSGPASSRSEGWKFGFEGSRCLACGTRHLPPARVCVKCHTFDEMTRERLADVQATIATFTIDRLAFSLSPPVVAAVVNLDGGGRFQCEMTDVNPAEVAIGGRVQFTFRRMLTAHSIHNYFWKARPVRG